MVPHLVSIFTPPPPPKKRDNAKPPFLLRCDEACVDSIEGFVRLLVATKEWLILGRRTIRAGRYIEILLAPASIRSSFDEVAASQVQRTQFEVFNLQRMTSA